jgi:hypothetical protein
MLLKGSQCICRGADPRAVNGEGKNPFEVAVESNFDDGEVTALLADSNITRAKYIKAGQCKRKI